MENVPLKERVSFAVKVLSTHSIQSTARIVTVLVKQLKEVYLIQNEHCFAYKYDSLVISKHKKHPPLSVCEKM